MFSWFSSLPFVKNLRIATRTLRHTMWKIVMWLWFGLEIFQMREAPVEMVDDFLATLEVGCFVALHFDNYDKEPVIGKAVFIDENHFQVHYWKGTYLGKWSPQHLPRRKTEPWLERLPKTCIVYSSFELNGDSKLMPATRNFLKERYTALRNSSAWKWWRSDQWCHKNLMCEILRIVEI